MNKKNEIQKSTRSHKKSANPKRTQSLPKKAFRNLLNPKTIRLNAANNPLVFYLCYFLSSALIFIITAFCLPTELSKAIPMTITSLYCIYIHVLQQYELSANNPRLRSNVASGLYLINTFLLIVFMGAFSVAIAALINSLTPYHNPGSIIQYGSLIAVIIFFVEFLVLAIKDKLYETFLIVTFILLTFLFIYLFSILVPAAISFFFSIMLRYFPPVNDPSLIALLESWSSRDKVLLHFFIASPQIKASIIAAVIAISSGLSGFIAKIVSKPTSILTGEEKTVASFIDKTSKEFNIFIEKCATNLSKKDMEKLLNYCNENYSYVYAHASENFSRTWQHLIWLLKRPDNAFPENVTNQKEVLYPQILTLIVTLDNYFTMHLHKTERYKTFFKPLITNKSVLFITQIIDKDKLLADMNIEKRTEMHPELNLADIRNALQKLNNKSWSEYWEKFSFA